MGTKTFIVLLLGFGVCSSLAAAETEPRPNVLLISLDDLNDWIEPLGGHPQTRTPHLAAFAEEAVTFSRAYCAAPSCNPSRTAIMTGKAPYVTGVYTNPQIWRHILPDEITLPEYFQRAGYWTYLPDLDADTGKTVFRKQDNELLEDDPKGLTMTMPHFKGMYIAFDWAPLPYATEETGDYESANWVVEQLGKQHDKPFFLACGIYRPHLPLYVPQKYFDRFPLDEVLLPDCIIEDLDDVPATGRRLARRRYHHHVTMAGEWRRAVQGYLAAINYADDLTGMVLDALAASDYADNTVVVIYSDHGFQLGEKQHWQKFALWESVIKSVLMVKAPEGVLGDSAEKGRGAVSGGAVSLMDIFPTLTEVCGLPEKPGMSGRSLVPLLKDPNARDDSRAIVTMEGWEHFSIRKGDWHYIRYGDGTAELYNLAEDPEEWRNLAGDARYTKEIEALRRHIPQERKPYRKTKPIRWADVLSGETKFYQ
ncbi:MAG: sulfatase [Planctomycetota bacterium]|jgi:arylsulfatase A-like enzyme